MSNMEFYSSYSPRHKFTVHTPALQYFIFIHVEKSTKIFFYNLDYKIFSSDFLLVIDVGLIRSLVDLYFDGPAPRGRIDPLVEAQEPRYRNPFNKNSFHFKKLNYPLLSMHALRCELENWCLALQRHICKINHCQQFLGFVVKYSIVLTL